MSTDGEGDNASPSWIFWAMAKVFSGLRAVVDFVWQWVQVPVGTFPMDTLNTLLLGWLAFGVLIVILAKFLYDKVIAWDQGEEDDSEFPSQEELEEPKLPDEGCKAPPPPPPVVSRKATIVPEGLRKHVSAPVASGGDPDAVRWINNLLVWFFEGAEGGRIVRDTWNDLLNDFTVGAALETGVLIEILEFFPQTPAPTLTNIIVDCQPNDDMTITCDLEATLYMRVQTTRTQRDVTTESEYACAVRPLRGRFNVSMRTHQCFAFMKFDGWPEVNMELEGVRNNTEGLDELQLQEVVKEELTAALRKVKLELDFLPKKSFPRFARERTLPESVIPVGYDALVREHQTHPPSFEPKIPASRTPVPIRSQKVQGINLSNDAQSLFPDPVLYKEGTLVGNVLSLPNEATSPVLTISEESLVKKNMDRYINEPADKRPHSVSPSPPRDSFVLKSPQEFAPGHAPLSRLSMVFSSREKPIDEPNGGLSNERNEPEEEEEEEDEVDDLFIQELKSDKSSLAGPPPPPRSPTRELESLKESFKGNQWNNPFSKPVPGGGSTYNSSLPVQSSAPVGIIGLNGKRLLVKVVKASAIGGNAGVSSCFAVVEMDDPAQKFTTNVVSDTSSPFWDEQFLFDLSDNTLELLFELYDKIDGRFVGLGIVGIEELVATPSQRQIIPLQGRPYEKDEVSGSLTCEFLFLDRADLPDLTLRRTTMAAQPSKAKTKTTTKTYTLPMEEKHPDEELEVSSSIAEAALKDLEARPDSSSHTANTRSTLIIHASRKESAKRIIKVTRAPSGEYAELPNGIQPMEEEEEQEYEEDGNYKPGVSASLGTGIVPPTTGTTHQRPTSSYSSSSQVPAQDPSAVIQTETAEVELPCGLIGSSNGIDNEERGRSRNRSKRDFFGTLRRRFSRSKLRSKSVDPTGVVEAAPVDESLDRTPLTARSISMERSSIFNRSRGLLTVPSIMKGRSSPSGGIGSGDSGSTRSSLSGTSGLSSASIKTYINEASLLVVETLENGVIKHYLVPLSLQRKNKWRKKGTKLHIYNEHTFVAKHLSSSLSCQVCQKGMGRRIGKQGYECRDCSFKCHKPCHVKAEIVCPNSTVNSMDLVYVKDEKPEKRKRLLSS